MWIVCVHACVCTCVHEYNRLKIILTIKLIVPTSAGVRFIEEAEKGVQWHDSYRFPVPSFPLPLTRGENPEPVSFCW